MGEGEYVEFSTSAVSSSSDVTLSQHLLCFLLVVT